MASVKVIAARKYLDKSKGQPELLPIFEGLKVLVSNYERGNLKVVADKPGHFELYYRKEVEVLGRKYPGLCFASVLIQKGYVGFYFFPIYVNPSLKEKLPPEVLKTLQGKTCFHIKKNDLLLLKQINDVLQCGYDFYQSRGWI